MQRALSQKLGVEEKSPLWRYLSLYFIRRVEEGIVERYSDQEMRCPVHLSIGQEATAVGVSSALGPADKVFSNHRCHAHYLAKGGDLYRMLCELYGKADGCVGGRGGSMHLMAPEVGVDISIPIVGSSIPLAVGQALQDRRTGSDRVTVCYLGDGCLEEGVFHECANFASLHDLPVLFACENNLYSVYTPLRQRQPNRPLSDLAKAHAMQTVMADGNDVTAVAGAAREAVDGLRRGCGPVFLEMPTYRHREHCGPNDDDHLGYREPGELAAWQVADPLPRARSGLAKEPDFNEVALQQIEQTIEAYIDETFDRARQAPYPAAIDPATGEYAPSDRPAMPVKATAAVREMSFAEAVCDGLGVSIDRDPSVYLMGEGIDDPSAFWGTTRGIAERFGPEKVVEMPISELGMTGVAIGSAMAGARPVINLQRVEFALLAMEQIVNNAGKAFFAGNGHHTAPITVRMIVGRGWGQGPQHAQSLESVFAHFPGLKVILPSFPADAKGMLCAAIADENPVLIIEHRWLHFASGAVPGGYYENALDGPKRIREGVDVTLVASSFMTLEAVRAAALLDRIGIVVDLIDLRVVRPLNIDPILASVCRTGRLVCVDLGWSLFGVSSEIVAQVAERCFDSLEKPPVRIGPAPYPTPSSRALVETYYPTARSIIESVTALLGTAQSDRDRILRVLDEEIGDLPVDVPDPAYKGPF
ncbi:MAG: thiamine pyrophosphate-dependent enzyme [Alphaproteobacteria bacterium]